MNAPERHISLHPFGDLSGTPLEELAAGVAAVFNREAESGEVLPLPRGALDYRRGQYRSTFLLETLKERREAMGAAGSGTLLLGVTAEDIFIPSFNFVFGEADPRGGVAVISLHRLRPEFYGSEPDPVLLKERALKEAVHEIGHVLGLTHCANPRCIMHFSNSIADTDSKGPGFCPECRARLNATGVHPKA